MNTKNVVTTPKEVELTENNDEHSEKIGVDVQIHYYTHVGWDGTLVMFFMLIIASLFGYITFMYTVSFSSFDREFVWLFIVMGGLFVLVVIYYLIRWKNLVNKFMEEEQKRHEDEAIAASWSQSIQARYESFQIHGKNYLCALYMGEIAESVNQTINAFTVYTCSLPLEITSVMFIALSIDCFHTVSFMAGKNSSNRRDRQIKVDASVDFLFAVLPMFFMWFGYNVPISVQDMIQLAVFPAFMMLLKLDSILEEIIRSRTATATFKAQENAAVRNSRHRNSLYRGLSHFEIADQQQAAVPRVVHMIAAGCKFLFGMIFLILAITHLASINTNNVECGKFDKWEEGCKVKVPFCNSPFGANCNCAVFEVNKHNWTTLPETELKQMTALKRLKMNHGPLKSMFRDFGNSFPKLAFLDFSYNELKSVPESFGTLKLNVLKLANNNLQYLPDEIWNNGMIFHLELDNNNVSVISSAIKNAKSLMLFYISNNSLSTLPNELFLNPETNINTKLVSFFIDGNYLKQIPQEIKHARALTNLKINNNRISNVPKEIGSLKRLSNIDLRNNNITDLPDEFLELKSSLQFTYLNNNPICSNGWLNAKKDIKAIVEKREGAGCNEQCSIYCQDRFCGNDFCGRGCNSASCKFDGGDCL